MLDNLTIPQAAIPFLIFFLRLLDMSMDTLRVLYVIRGKRTITWILGFVQSCLWVLAITSVLANLDNVFNIISYAAGFASGNVLGMIIEERLAVGHGNLRIISARRGNAVGEGLREAGFGVTELPGRGKDGMVMIIDISVRRREVKDVYQLVNSIDPDAFITMEDIRPLHRGYWRA